MADKVSHSDYHATLLHLFGLDPEQLLFKRNGQDRSSIDGQPSQVVEKILA